MAIFAIAEKTEATSRGWALELDTKEKRKRLSYIKRCTKKAFRRCGKLF
ncbi:hypothetical protein G159_11930 [Planococcus glaciei CHR43]|nr:hypothetical protein G159_11930 [Planococcus glaciei CHR43]